MTEDRGKVPLSIALGDIGWYQCLQLSWGIGKGKCHCIFMDGDFMAQNNSVINNDHCIDLTCPTKLTEQMDKWNINCLTSTYMVVRQESSAHL